ncbi:LysM peptidoglycan-binding domain-containing protein [Herbidospora sp. NBRC 101105]|uniref:LysM peptidoglycan-binding domain-containing protein n=1 Tax=Herbidospora sp. NBRC 101105 TaxID=3032195 RepID=UPI0024A18BEC|nr:LysM peptidoglycan-binding domain-containing protein [Herbidospora sp. NBRC 101105]GLX94680.1 hypothetical protein Hesp01_26300 [Herbidospora sp. NBRC 101105]
METVLSRQGNPSKGSLPGSRRWGDAERPSHVAVEGRRTERENPPPLRLTRRGRIVLVILIAIVSLAALWLGTRAAVTASTTRPVEGLPRVTVQEGDTLWEIAVSAVGAGDPGVVVREIMDLNGLPDPLIRPGTTLYLPRDVPGQ